MMRLCKIIQMPPCHPLGKLSQDIDGIFKMFINYICQSITCGFFHFQLSQVANNTSKTFDIDLWP